MSQIPVPSNFAYWTTIPVRRSDTRSATVVGGLFVSHLTYETLIPLINEAFDAFLENYSWSKANIAGSNIIIPRLEADYKSEAKSGDILKFEIAVSNLGRKSCDLIFQVTKNPQGEEVATVKISLVFYDYVSRKTMEIPEGFRSRFSE
ncbi:thioesterase-like family protein [Leptospira inadai serovar Lyme str. 10]|uniref:Thioesterase-like family protein n=2 Tax=Leptospira inadai serovar Lyme TaxID=293084 RepID=V6HEX1_9LEPT|nr:thioesterase family protein [Leptospira inadai]EQA38732.1 thioesterase-like family protein [Leptospira inadai serovar Lyme str. 10]PNV74221.1 esterase [Leptospira inadai serovar Lyme]